MNEELRNFLVLICLGFIAGSSISNFFFDGYTKDIIIFFASIAAVILYFGRRRV